MLELTFNAPKMRENTLRQTMHVRVVNETNKFQPSDWSKLC